MAIDEIKNGEISKLRYWPFEQKYRKIFEFITKHEHYVSNMIQDVNATFHVFFILDRGWRLELSAVLTKFD